jgi:hypothetical protein
MKRLIALSLTTLALALSSCGDEEEVSPAALAPAVTTGSLKLLNNCSTSSITSAHLSPSSQSTWGANKLSAAIAAGSNFTMTDLTPGNYDGKAVVLGVYSIYSGVLFNIPITAGNTYTATANDSTFTGSMEITNGTVGSNITGLYVSPTSSPTWGPNYATSNITPSGKKHLYDMPAGNYDVKVVWNVGADSIYTGGGVASLVLTTLTVN